MSTTVIFSASDFVATLRGRTIDSSSPGEPSVTVTLSSSATIAPTNAARQRAVGEASSADLSE